MKNTAIEWETHALIYKSETIKAMGMGDGGAATSIKGGYIPPEQVRPFAEWLLSLAPPPDEEVAAGDVGLWGEQPEETEKRPFDNRGFL